MSRKKLTPEDIKIHVDSICDFLKSEKTYSETQKFNSRFYNLKDILISKKVITEIKIGNRKMYKFNEPYVLFPRDYEILAKEYSKKIKKQNDRFLERFPKIKHRVKPKSKVQYFNPNLPSVKDPIVKNLKTKDLLSQIDSLKHQIQLGQEVSENAKASYEQQLNAQSDYITEKLVEIESLKQELFKQKSTNKHYIIKILGIPLIKIENRKK